MDQFDNINVDDDDEKVYHLTRRWSNVL